MKRVTWPRAASRPSDQNVLRLGLLMLAKPMAAMAAKKPSLSKSRRVDMENGLSLWGEEEKSGAKAETDQSMRMLSINKASTNPIERLTVIIMACTKRLKAQM